MDHFTKFVIEHKSNIKKIISWTDCIGHHIPSEDKMARIAWNGRSSLVSLDFKLSVILDAGQISHQIYNYEILVSSQISHQTFNYEILDCDQMYHQIWYYEILDSNQIFYQINNYEVLHHPSKLNPINLINQWRLWWILAHRHLQLCAIFSSYFHSILGRGRCAGVQLIAALDKNIFYISK